MTVKKGDKVTIDYTGTLDDGSVFDSSKNKQPIEFEVGSGRVIKGFEDSVIGMKKGEEKKISLKPAEAYGDHNPAMVIKIPRDKLPPGPEPKSGMMLAIGTPDGNKFPAKIIEVTDAEVTLDVNHPLAGKNLNFAIKLVDVS